MAKKKRRGERPQSVDLPTVLRVFKESRKPLSQGELVSILKLSGKEAHRLRPIIEQLLDTGKLIKLGRGSYGLTERLKLITGKLEVQRSGVGFVIPEDKRRTDIFVSPQHFNGAWHGDRVAVALLPESHGRRPEGRIARVLERGATKLAVRVQRRMGELLLCRPTDPKRGFHVMVKAEELVQSLGQDVFDGDILLVEPGEQLDRDLYSATALSRLGPEGEVGVQESLVKSNYDIPAAFPQAALEQAATLPEAPGEADLAGREDLRALDLVTIDGATARDFDDAVCVHREGEGYRLWVAIADVAHYVHPGTPLDEEAYTRGNSYYFPQSVCPMFPEALSNGLCSLNPHVDRLCMVVETAFDRHGRPGESRLYQAVMHSKARLTYDQVQRAVLLREEEERANLAAVLPMLEVAEELARKINALRNQRGSLDFDLPEPEILFNLQGETTDIRRRTRHFGHQIIEEFMIAANEAVARFLTEREFPCLYRIHPEPDPGKLAALFKLLQSTSLGPQLDPEQASSPTPEGVQQLLALAQGTEQEYVVNRLTLRSMMQASYDPVNEGHFGLASDCYCHFTSPIRRYADLVVHRSVKVALHLATWEQPFHSLKQLKKVAEQLSATERVAMEAEREILKRLTVLFLEDKVGAEFTGVVSGMSDFGFWVELNEVMAEGLVRLSTLNDDYYAYLSDKQVLLGERTGRAITLGQEVRVLLTDVHIGRLEVNLELAAPPERAAAGRRAKFKRRG
ncbi:ribonuclease R [Megalodesulfovibrio paquesii]